MTDTGILYGTTGHHEWPVTYRIHEQAGAINGTIEFAPGTRLEPGNLTLPVFLHLADGRWAEVYLPPQPADHLLFDVRTGSRIVDAPKWAGKR